MYRKHIAKATGAVPPFVTFIAMVVTAGCGPAQAQGGSANASNAAPVPQVVRTASELWKALDAARGGEVLRAAPGQYDGVNIQGRTYPKPVRITALAPDAPPVFRSLVIDASDGIVLQGVELEAPPSGAAANVWRSRNVVFDRVSVHGILDGSNGQGDGPGIQIQDSSHVSVLDSEVQEVVSGLQHNNSNNLIFRGNYIHNIQLDGIRGGGSSFVEISSNRFANFYPTPGDHGDAIQFWTSGVSTSAHDIVIRGNVAERGTGGVMEGLFMRDETDGKLPYRNVTIADNAFIGTNWEGLSVYYGDGVTVVGNTVAGYRDQGTRFNLTGVANLTLRDNAGNDFLTTGQRPVEQARNAHVKPLSVGDRDYLKSWLSTRPAVLETLSRWDALSPPGAARRASGS